MKLTWYGQSAFRVDVERRLDPHRSVPFRQSAVEAGVGRAGRRRHPCAAHPRPQRPSRRLGGHPEEDRRHARRQFRDLHVPRRRRASSGEKINPGNTGGTVDCGGFTTTFVQALHSSSFDTGDGSNVYLGNPLGLVLHFPEDKTLYHMGDTDIFSDMALINELHEPKIGLVPVGDRFTMGGAVAALACRRFFKFETVVPCHYKTFGLLDQTPDKFVEGMEGSGVKVVVPEVGQGGQDVVKDGAVR